MGAQPRPLIAVWAELPAVRSHPGTRHPLAARLALACSALRCGSRSSTAMAEWGRHSGARLTHAVGVPRPPPGAATLHTVLQGVERAAWAATLGAWAAGLLAAPPASPDAAAGRAVAGQTRRGSQQPGAPGAPRRSALGHRRGLTLAQQAVADQTNAMPVGLEWRRQGVLEGRGVTREAWLTHRPIAQQSVEAGGDEGLGGKGHQPP